MPGTHYGLDKKLFFLSRMLGIAWLPLGHVYSRRETLEGKAWFPCALNCYCQQKLHPSFFN